MGHRRTFLHDINAHVKKYRLPQGAELLGYNQFTFGS